VLALLLRWLAAEDAGSLVLFRQGQAHLVALERPRTLEDTMCRAMLLQLNCCHHSEV